MTPSPLTQLHLDSGFYPLATLATGAALWVVFRLFLYKKSRPHTAVRFLAAGLCLVVLSGFYRFSTSYPLWQFGQLADITPSAASTADAPLLIQLPLNLPAAAVDTGAASDSPSLRRPVLYTFGALYLLGVAVILLHTLYQLLRLRQLRATARPAGNYGRWTVYETDLPAPFSYGRHIFIPSDTEPSLRPSILAHEDSHLRHNHFRQLCCFRLLLAVGWFNPFLWLLLADLKMLHEMQADDDVLLTGIEKSTYQMSLLTICTHGVRQPCISSPFGSSPLKARILFMNRRSDHLTGRWRIAAATAVFAGLAFVALGCRTSPSTPKTLIENTASGHRHPLYGTWRLVRLGDARSGRMDEWPREQYKFYGNELFFNIHIKAGNTQEPNSVYEGVSGSFKYISDTEVEEHGRHCDIRRPNDSTLIFTYTNSDGVSAIDAPVVTEEWVRCDTPDMIKEMIGIVN